MVGLTGESVDSRPASRISPALSAAVTTALAVEGEPGAWALAAQEAARLCGADAAMAIEILPNDRAVIRSVVAIPLRLDEEFPIAPDSQAAFIARSDEIVVSPDLATEDRFVAGALLTRCGIQSSVSARFALEDGHWGLLGVYWLAPGCPGRADVSEFELFVKVVGTVIPQHRSRRRLELSARRDSLTGLWNREASLRALADRLGSGATPTVLLIDLDGFKSVNDELGHRAGDTVLAVTAERLDRLVTTGGLVGRLGGDEFIVILDETDRAEASRLASRLIGAIEETIGAEGRIVQVSASIGVAEASPGNDAALLINRADRAMYAAKAAGRGRVHLAPVARRGHGGAAGLDGPGTASVGADEYCLATIDEALGGLRMLVQPIVDARTHALMAADALVRGPAGHSLELPDVLFPIATTFGRLGRLELEAKRLAFALPLPAGLPLFVNLEPILLSDPVWFGALRDLWSEASPSREVVAEITERAVLASPGRLLAAVEACRELGWRIALDNVGSRTETLAALRWLEPDVVKVDTGVLLARNTAHAANVAAALAAYRDDHDLRIVAGGVESERHLDFTSLLGADYLAGSLFGCPAAPEDISGAGRRSRAHQAAVGRTSTDRIVTKRDLLGLSRSLESVALTADTVVLASFQRAEHLTKRTRRQYAALARRCGFVGLLGHGLRRAVASNVPGAHVADLDPDDPLTRSWHVVVISPTTSIALLADEVEMGPIEAPDMERLFRYRLSTGRSAVDDAARRLLRYF
jgi:diguanylate cyclase (GGDEF)-like protein